MDSPILDDERHVIGLLGGGNAPEENVEEEEDIEEDNDDAQDTSESLDGEADYADMTVIGTSNIELDNESDSEYRTQRMRYMLYSCM